MKIRRKTAAGRIAGPENIKAIKLLIQNIAITNKENPLTNPLFKLKAGILRNYHMSKSYPKVVRLRSPGSTSRS